MRLVDIQGVVPTLWSADGIRAAWSGGGKELFLTPGFNTVQLHTWPSTNSEAVLREMRAIKATLKVMFGFGVDGIARGVAKKERTAVNGARTLRSLASQAVNQGAFAVVYNAEGDWKTPPNTEQRKRIVETIQTALAWVRADHPNLLIGHTSFDHPTYHATYPWEAWLGKDSPVDFSMPQVYAGVEGVMARMGGLDRREAAALASWASAIRHGWVRDADKNPATHDPGDVAWVPYYQGHHVLAADSIGNALQRAWCGVWASPTRLDAEGTRFVRCVARLHELGYWHPGGVMRFQEFHGLKVDDIAGPITQAKILEV